ncbi:D-alanyl-D-alanine carboxypeptidase-like protein [Humitalea rosea]|uniref:D-alanyl-D-alanine carboxypeptidase-like protein n=1 Tax=Humitalea rosea TaxID=990373 RepID=A0A2W7IFX5_9PROT|nr:M15 family metallopeptidase [Humitalea rosea]PZW45633.1 D-alanyl-D-alanine carboxypeptidase-like protein [Humitalea rosea]
MPGDLSWGQFQAVLKADGLYAGEIDGAPNPAILEAIEARFSREAMAGRLAGGWEGWGPERRKIAVEQSIIRDAGIEVGKIDGLSGPSTSFGRDSFQSLQRTGKPLLIEGRDETPRHPIPASGKATIWPRQDECEAFYGPVGQNQVMLTLPYEMRLAWDTSQRVTRFSCHAKVQPAFQRVFQRVLETYGEAKIHALRLDLFGGCLNVRKMRGGTKMSMHSWGIAIDLDPERNTLTMNHQQAAFAKPDYEPFWAIVEEEGLVSLGRTRDFDWMHFQAARL